MKRARQFTPNPQWWKHLRPHWKRVFWSRERAAAARDVREQLREAANADYEDWWEEYFSGYPYRD